LSSKPVIVLGSGGHAQVCIDALILENRNILGIITPDKQKKSVLDIPVIGNDDCISRYSPEDIELVNGIGFLPGSSTRKKIFERFKSDGYRFSQVIHPATTIAGTVHLAEGCHIMAGVVIQTGTRVGENTVVNTNCVVDHGCHIADNCHLAPSVTLCGNVAIGVGTFVGAGSTVSNGLTIGMNSIIASGKTVIRAMEENSVLIKDRQDVAKYEKQ
jgi:sugar O-acyltransferase (sialic acid O-acetyltransferase NeuD family)